MKVKNLFIISAVGFSLLISSSFMPREETLAVEWISWDEAVELTKQKGNTKKVFIDIYTDWCGWCKVMDKKTFNHPEVAKYMKERYHMVKFNAESRKEIVYNGHTFKFVPSGKRGYHQLAATLLNGKLSFPTVLFMDEEMKILSPVPGYQPPENFYKMARYFGDDNYKKQKWVDFEKSYKVPF